MKKNLSQDQEKELLETLQKRFEKNQLRHQKTEWSTILKKLKSKPEILWSLFQMESTGGEPDVVESIGKKGEIAFVDCSAESPKERRSICYDRKALDARKLHKPASSARDMATEMNIEILTEADYRELQKVGEFDLKTSSWVFTPDDIRKRGGALFCDRRYDTVFVYHNGADSYYGARGFRGKLTL